MLGEHGEWGGVQDAQSVTLSLREPHTTPSVAYLASVCVCVCVCLCVDFTSWYL